MKAQIFPQYIPFTIFFFTLRNIMILLENTAILFS